MLDIRSELYKTLIQEAAGLLPKTHSAHEIQEALLVNDLERRKRDATLMQGYPSVADIKKIKPKRPTPKAELAALKSRLAAALSSEQQEAAVIAGVSLVEYAIRQLEVWRDAQLKPDIQECERHEPLQQV